MPEVQHRTENVHVPHANLARPLFVIGVLVGLAGIILFQLAVREITLAGYDVTEASYVLGLLAFPVVFFSLVWGYRSFASAVIFGTIGLLIAVFGVGLFSYYYPDQINAFDTSGDNQTVLVMNVYLVGLLVLLVGLFIGNTLRAKRLEDLTRFLEAGSEATVIPVPGPPLAMGQTLPVSRLEGIKRPEVRRLREAGVNHTGQLLYRDPAELGRTANVDEVRVRAWQAMADLVRINGIGPGFAATLYRSGIVNVGQLADETPETLIQRLERAPKTLKTRSKQRIDVRRARAWIEEARRLAQQVPQTSPVMTTAPPSAAAAAQ